MNGGSLRELALFAGAGGGILGGKLLGWTTVCAVERNRHARNVLLARQNDGILEPFPIWDDVRTFDGRPWRGLVDMVSGGFPCQDISCAGKGAGLAGTRSGLWREMSRIVGEVGPRFVFVENSPQLKKRGLARVLGDLTELGYNCKWGVVGASAVGLPHRRARLWLVADSHIKPVLQAGKNPNTRRAKVSRGWDTSDYRRALSGAVGATPECLVCGNASGVARWMEPYKAVGNGQVPAVARLAWEILGGASK